MRKVRLSTFLTLDGVMQAPGGPTEDWTGGFTYGGWLAPHFDETVGEMMEGWIGRDYDLLLGRKTYEIFAAHWPEQDDQIGQTFNAIEKFVVAGPDTPLTWSNSHRPEGEPGEAVRRLKSSGDRDLLIQGSGQLVQALLAADVIDEITLMAFPILLGQGKRLFRDGIAATAWRMTESRHSPSGVLCSRYVRAGQVETAAIAPQVQNGRETARQKRMRREG
ncbi:MAG: dihydrofolate reductase family protein [Caulobacteraceae bacterium]|nr:dihydrofolate reductase family protein [Caulobacteraceae bacterium]